MSATIDAPAIMGNDTNPPVRGYKKRPLKLPRVILHSFLTLIALAWFAPLGWAVYTSVRPYAETARKGYVSWPDALTLKNYRDAFTEGRLLHFFWNTALIVVPALLLTLFVSSMAAFVLSRFNFRGAIPILLLLTAGNLLPHQVIITPLFHIFRLIPLPTFLNVDGTLLNSYWAVLLVYVASQTGFCTFVLANFMRMIPDEMMEAAVVDGASAWRQYFSIVLPLCRPALAALGTLEFTWMYNDFFWALVLMVSGDKRPITSALDNLKGTFFTDNNLIAAGSVLVAVPTILVYIFLQKQFVAGLTVGATKG